MQLINTLVYKQGMLEEEVVRIFSFDFASFWEGNFTF
jgi:hypothetical protein